MEGLILSAFLSVFVVFSSDRGRLKFLSDEWKVRCFWGGGRQTDDGKKGKIQLLGFNIRTDATAEVTMTSPSAAISMATQRDCRDGDKRIEASRKLVCGGGRVKWFYGEPLDYNWCEVEYENIPGGNRVKLGEPGAGGTFRCSCWGRDGLRNPGGFSSE